MALTAHARPRPRFTLPRPPRTVLDRPRLGEALAQGLDGGTVLVVAPAGYGKTTAVTQWLRESSIEAAWLSLNAAHRTALTLVGDMIEALARVHPPVEALRAQVAAGEGPQHAVDQVGALLDALEQADDYAVLVVDAGYVLRDADEACAVIEQVAEALPSSLGLVLLTRERPPIPSLARHVAGGTITILDVAQLAFTSEESAALLAQLDTPEAIRELVVERAAGWPLALALLGRRGERPSVGEARVLDADLDEFIRAEVVDPLTASDRSLLEACAVPAHFDGDIAAEISGRTDAAAVLHSLELRTGLITGVGDGRWLRMHALLREHCLARLSREDPARLGTYRARAARSLVGAGELDDATELALDAEAWLQARDLIREQAEALTGRGAWATLTDWIGRLPAEVLADAPDLALVRVLTTIRLNRLAEAHVLLDGLDTQLTDDRDVARALLYRGIAWRQARRLDDALAAHRRARAMVWESEPEGSDLRIELDLEEGTILGMRGELTPAIEALERSSTAAERGGHVRFAANAFENLGMALMLSGRLAAAREAFGEARGRWAHLGEREGVLLTRNNEATVMYALGDLAAARTTLEEIAAQVERDSRLGALAAVGLADIARDLGELDRAEVLYVRAQEAARVIEHRGVHAAAAFGRAMLMVERGDATRARQLAEEHLRATEQQGAAEFASRFRIALARVLLLEGRPDEALELAESVIAGPGGGYQRRQNALLARATAEYALGERAAAARTLAEVHALVEAIGYDQFLVADARLSGALLGSAEASTVASGYFRRLAERAGTGAWTSDAAGRGQAPAGDADHVPPDLVVRAFGTPVVERGGVPGELGWRSERSKELLLFLLSRRGPASREEVEAALWPDAPASQLSSLFHSNLHRLRRTVGETAITRGRDGYRLNPELHIDFDVERFEQHLATADEAARADDAEARTAALRAATTLYAGPFARPFDSPWAEDLRGRLEDRYVASALALARLDIAGGRHTEAVELAESVLEIDGLNEEAVRHLIAAHVGAGFPDLALRAYRRLQELSQRELGVPLSGETRRALERTLSGLG